VLTALAGLELVLGDLGYPVSRGASLRAAEEVLGHQGRGMHEPRGGSAG